MCSPIAREGSDGVNPCCWASVSPYVLCGFILWKWAKAQDWGKESFLGCSCLFLPALCFSHPGSGRDDPSQ